MTASGTLRPAPVTLCPQQFASGLDWFGAIDPLLTLS
jgi:hypothetical protein